MAPLLVIMLTHPVHTGRELMVSELHSWLVWSLNLLNVFCPKQRNSGVHLLSGNINRTWQLVCGCTTSFIHDKLFLTSIISCQHSSLSPAWVIMLVIWLQTAGHSASRQQSDMVVGAWRSPFCCKQTVTAHLI